MLSKKAIKNRSVNSLQITTTTSKPAETGRLKNPYRPFIGINGRKYEIQYKNPLNKTTNCYAFAMGWQSAASDKCFDYIPGFLSGMKFSFGNIPELIRADLEAVDRNVYEVLYDIPEKLPDGEGYWVKIVIYTSGDNQEFHIMRKDKKSGRWIHKMGWEYPPKLVVRNTEFRDKVDAVIAEMRAKGINLTGMSKEDIKGIAAMFFPPEYYTGITVVKNECETDDSADYISFSENEEQHTYKVLCAMRVSEP